ncbi:MAG: hypothetical protein E3J72_14950, partial [Planctomycetota bacterium]
DSVNPMGTTAGTVWSFSVFIPVTVSISSIDPVSGLCAGLTFVNVYGNEFDGTCTVLIRGTPAYGVTLQNVNWITCFAPAGAEGFANVSVDKGPGLANDTLIDGYEYLAFPAEVQVNTTQTVTWADQCDPELIITSMNAAIVYFGDNRRADMNSRFSSEIYWSTEPWGSNVAMYGTYNSSNVPYREEPQVILGSGQDLFMTWLQYDGGNESVYFASTPDNFVWSTPVKVCDVNDVFGDWIEDSKMVYIPGAGELSVFIMSGNDDEISQIVRFISTDDGLTWPSSDNVTDADDPIWDFDAAANSLGGIGVVYANVTNIVTEDVQIYAKYWNGVSWTGPFRVDNDSTDATKGFPILRVGSDDTLYAAWIDNRSGNLDIYFSKSFDNGATWTGNSIVDDNASDTWEFDFIIDSLDNMWIGIIDNRSALVNSTWVTGSTDWGNTWSAPVQADSGTSNVEGIDMACLDNGTLYGAVRFNDDIYVITSTDGGSTWAAPIRATSDLEDTSAGALEDFVRVARHDGGLGNMCALWLTGQPMGTFSPQIRTEYSDDDGASWTSDNTVVNDILFLPPEDEEDLRGDPVLVAAPTLLANAGATLAFFAAWSDGRNSSSDWDQTGAIYFNWANASGDWQEYPNICVTDSPGTLFETDPYLAMDNAGTMLCVWTEYDGTSEWQSEPKGIRVARSTDWGQTWGNYDYLNTSSTNWRRNPRLVYDEAKGLWYAVWQDSRNGGDNWDWDIYCKVSDDGGVTWENETQVNTVASSYTQQPIPVIDPTNGRLYVFWMEGGVAYQFSDNGCQTWNGSDTWVDNSGWPSGNARSYDVAFTPEGAAQIVIDHTDGSPEITDWRVLLQRGLPGINAWGPPISVPDEGVVDSTVLKCAGALAVKPSTSEVIIVWPDARDDLTYDRNTEVYTTKGR